MSKEKQNINKIAKQIRDGVLENSLNEIDAIYKNNNKKGISQSEEIIQEFLKVMDEIPQKEIAQEGRSFSLSPKTEASVLKVEVEQLNKSVKKHFDKLKREFDSDLVSRRLDEKINEMEDRQQKAYKIKNPNKRSTVLERLANELHGLTTIKLRDSKKARDSIDGSQNKPVGNKKAKGEVVEDVLFNGATYSKINKTPEVVKNKSQSDNKKQTSVAIDKNKGKKSKKQTKKDNMKMKNPYGMPNPNAQNTEDYNVTKSEKQRIYTQEDIDNAAKDAWVDMDGYKEVARRKAEGDIEEIDPEAVTEIDESTAEVKSEDFTKIDKGKAQQEGLEQLKNALDDARWVFANKNYKNNNAWAHVGKMLGLKKRDGDDPDMQVVKENYYNALKKYQEAQLKNIKEALPADQEALAKDMFKFNAEEAGKLFDGYTEAKADSFSNSKIMKGISRVGKFLTENKTGKLMMKGSVALGVISGGVRVALGQMPKVATKFGANETVISGLEKVAFASKFLAPIGAGVAVGGLVEKWQKVRYENKENEEKKKFEDMTADEQMMQLMDFNQKSFDKIIKTMGKRINRRRLSVLAGGLTTVAAFAITGDFDMSAHEDVNTSIIYSPEELPVTDRDKMEEYLISLNQGETIQGGIVNEELLQQRAQEAFSQYHLTGEVPGIAETVAAVDVDAVDVDVAMEQIDASGTVDNPLSQRFSGIEITANGNGLLTVEAGSSVNRELANFLEQNPKQVLNDMSGWSNERVRSLVEQANQITDTSSAEYKSVIHELSGIRADVISREFMTDNPSIDLGTVKPDTDFELKFTKLDGGRMDISITQVDKPHIIPTQEKIVFDNEAETGGEPTLGEESNVETKTVAEESLNEISESNRFDGMTEIEIIRELMENPGFNNALGKQIQEVFNISNISNISNIPLSEYLEDRYTDKDTQLRLIDVISRSKDAFGDNVGEPQKGTSVSRYFTRMFAQAVKEDKIADVFPSSTFKI